uniref:hypothetical protein n=1 Tax=Klebsiella aerogenes TaxID=548 RepID=UPI0013D1815D
SPLRAIGRHLPWGLKEAAYKILGRLKVSHEAIEMDPELTDEVGRIFFASEPAADHWGGCVSSRHWDAIGCGTVQLLVAGRYN